MTTELRSSVNVSLGWTWRDRLGACLVTDSSRLEFAKELADGSESDQADCIWHAQDIALAPGQSTTLCLGALQQSLFGYPITIGMAKVKAIVIVNKTAVTAGYLAVGGAGTREWCGPFGMLGDTIKVMPGSPVILAHVRQGWEIDSANDALKISAIGGDAIFDIAILGTSESSGGWESSGNPPRGSSGT